MDHIKIIKMNFEKNNNKRGDGQALWDMISPFYSSREYLGKA